MSHTKKLASTDLINEVKDLKKFSKKVYETYKIIDDEVYELLEEDSGYTLKIISNNNVEIHLPRNLKEGFTIKVLQKGAGSVTFIPLNDATLINSSNIFSFNDLNIRAELTVDENTDRKSAVYNLYLTESSVVSLENLEVPLGMMVNSDKYNTPSSSLKEIFANDPYKWMSVTAEKSTVPSNLPNGISSEDWVAAEGYLAPYSFCLYNAGTGKMSVNFISESHCTLSETTGIGGGRTIDVPEHAAWMQHHNNVVTMNNIYTNEFAFVASNNWTSITAVTWGSSHDNMKTMMYPWGTGLDYGTDWYSQIHHPFIFVHNGYILFYTEATDATSGTGVYRSDGVTHTKVSSFKPRKFQITSNGVIYTRSFGTATTFYTSSDGGITWVTRTSPANINQSGNSNFMDYSNGNYIIVTLGGDIYTSTDLINWTIRTSAFGAQNLENIYTVGDYVFIGRSTAATTAQYSADDGLTWTLTAALGSSSVWYFFIQMANGQYIALSDNRIAYTANPTGAWSSTGVTDMSTNYGPWMGEMAYSVADNAVLLKSASGPKEFIYYKDGVVTNEAFNDFFSCHFLWDTQTGFYKIRVRN